MLEHELNGLEKEMLNWSQDLGKSKSMYIFKPFPLTSQHSLAYGVLMCSEHHSSHNDYRLNFEFISNVILKNSAAI